MNAQSMEETGFGGGLFKPLTLAILLGVGLFAFAAYFTLSGFVDELKRSDNGGAHALSKSANGFAGIVELLRSQDVMVTPLRNDIPLRKEALTIYTLPSTNVAGGIEKINLDNPTLFVLPKWNSYSLLKQKEIARGTPFPEDDIEEAVIDIDEDLIVSREAGARKVTIRPDDLSTTRAYLSRAQTQYSVPEVSRVQTMQSNNLQPLLVAGNGIILGRLTGTDIYILSDPDLLNNNGIQSLETSRLAMDMIDMTRFADDPVYIDLVLHGLATRSNLIKTALTPPFLSATLCLFGLGILLAWRAFSRFGAAVPTGRVFALGKEALAENSADLVQMTKRQINMAAPYSAYILSSTAQRLSVPPNMPETHLLALFDRHSAAHGTSHLFSDIIGRVRSAKTADELEISAKHYQIWTKEIARGHS